MGVLIVSLSKVLAAEVQPASRSFFFFLSPDLEGVILSLLTTLLFQGLQVLYVHGLAFLAPWCSFLGYVS